MFLETLPVSPRPQTEKLLPHYVHYFHKITRKKNLNKKKWQVKVLGIISRHGVVQSGFQHLTKHN